MKEWDVKKVTSLLDQMEDIARELSDLRSDISANISSSLGGKQVCNGFSGG